MDVCDQGVGGMLWQQLYVPVVCWPYLHWYNKSIIMGTRCEFVRCLSCWGEVTGKHVMGHLSI